jgi:acylphosphatase
MSISLTPAGHNVTHVVVHGKVQGVGYRAFVVDRAHRHGLEGWVRNRRDGTVEAVFAGPPQAVEAMLADCRRGPPVAQVETVHDKPGTADLLALRPPGEAFAALATV